MHCQKARRGRQLFVVWDVGTVRKTIQMFHGDIALFKVKVTLCISRLLDLEVHILFSSTTKGDIGSFCKDYIMFSRTFKKNDELIFEVK